MKNLTISKKIIIGICVILGICLILSILTIKKYIKELPSIEELQEYKPNLTTKIYDINNILIDELYIERRTFTPLTQIPNNLINGIIAIEDNDFYSHWGIDPIGIVRAAIKNILSGKVVQGGSTITQQLAKGLFLTRERKISRKIKEAILSIKLESRYSKNEILEMYLNHIYLGHGVYGINLAADLYFKKHPASLTLEESAFIAGLPKAPAYYSPFKRPEASLKRRNLVLSAMYNKHFISKQQLETALQNPLGTAEQTVKEKYASYFVEHIRQKLEPYYGDLLYKGGLKIYTTIDINMQIAAVQSIEKHLSKFDNIKKEKILQYLEDPNSLSKNDEDIKLYESTQTYTNVQGALIALDVKTGQIRALVGGRDFKESQWNRVTQAKRQPGSGFKPIIYAAAIDQGYIPTTILKDEPLIYYNNGVDWELIGNTTDFSDVPIEIMETLTLIEEEGEEEEKKYDPMQIWTPGNYTKKYLGDITLRTSLEKSINVTSIKLLEMVKPTTAALYAKKLGIKSHISPYLSMVLGTFVVTPIELANAYSTIANSGIKTSAYAIIKIYDNEGHLLEEHAPIEKAAISEQSAYIVTNLLRGVVENGTGRRARRLRRPAAGKTGTTNKYSDAWFIGYTPQLATTVWVGYDDPGITLGKNKTGGSVACPIWTEFMKEALKDKPKLEFSIPKNIVFMPINKKTGLKALELNEDSYMEAFLEGTDPEELSIYSELFLALETLDEEIESSTTTTDIPISTTTLSEIYNLTEPKVNVSTTN